MQTHTHHMKFIGYLLFAAFVIVVDQLSKQIAYANLLGQPSIEVLPFFQLTLVFNRGAAFGFLNDASGWQHYFFITIAIVVSLVLVGWLWRAQHRNAILCWGLALILGGALGNLIDRVNQQFVIDFISLHYGQWQFPTFNIADGAITLGAVALILDTLGFGARERDE